jgi:putative transcriptional regulator
MNTKAVGETLRKLRGSRTQSEVAKALDISISALSMYENGERIPRDEVKKRISELYGRTVQYIFFRE